MEDTAARRAKATYLSSAGRSCLHFVLFSSSRFNSANFLSLGFFDAFGKFLGYFLELTSDLAKISCHGHEFFGAKNETADAQNDRNFGYTCTGIKWDGSCRLPRPKRPICTPVRVRAASGRRGTRLEFTRCLDGVPYNERPGRGMVKAFTKAKGTKHAMKRMAKSRMMRCTNTPDLLFTPFKSRR